MRTTLLSAAAVLAICSGSALAQQPSKAVQPVELPMPEKEVSTERLMETIRSLPSKRSSWGDEAHRKGLRDVEKQLFDKLKALGYTPQLDPIDFIGHRVQKDGDKPEAEGGDGAPYNNIVVDIPGATLKDKVLVLSAHMDAVAGAPGADDDGSGVAVLIEAARLLRNRPTQRTIRLVLFNLEENGMVGPQAYTQRIKPVLDEVKEQIVGMVSMDMLGFYSDKPDSQKTPLPPMEIPGVISFKPPTVADFIGGATILRFRKFSRALDKQMKLAEPDVKTVLVDFLPVAPPDLLRSDHAPFIALGVPAVILSDTANFRNPNYHKPGDTIETIDPDRLTIAAKAVIGGYYRLAGPPGTELIDITPPPPKPKPAPEEKAEPGKTEPAKSPVPAQP